MSQLSPPNTSRGNNGPGYQLSSLSASAASTSLAHGLPPIRELMGLLTELIISDDIIIMAKFVGTPVLLKFMRLIPKIKKGDKSHQRLVKELLPPSVAISHPNIMEVFGYKFEGVSWPCLVVRAPSSYRFLEEYVRAEDEDTEISVAEKLTYLHQIGQALDFLHKQTPPIIHGNVVPDGILVVLEDLPRALLFDAGLNSVQREISNDHTHDSSRWRINEGMRYTSPEAAEDTLPYSPAEDVWSFGVVMLALMSNTVPWPGEKLVVVVQRLGKLTEDQTPFPPEAYVHDDLPRDDPLWAIMVRQWRVERTERPSIDDVLQAIASHPGFDTTSFSRALLPPVSDVPTVILTADTTTPVAESSPQQQDRFKLSAHPTPEGNLEVDQLVGEVKPLPEDQQGDTHDLDGSYSFVRRGIWLKPDSPPIDVAIKTLRTNRISDAVNVDIVEHRMHIRVKRESVAWNGLVHPNVLRLYGYQIQNYRATLVSPWCPNKDLHRFLIVCRDQLTFSFRFELVVQIARGVEYLHSVVPEVSHGDIKSKNVVMDAKLKPLICDFGLARFKNQTLNNMETTGNTCGTLGYMAPELENRVDTSQEADVFALGCLILEILSDHLPYYRLIETKNAVEHKRKVIAEQYPLRSDHPNVPETHPIWDLLEGCWKVDPAARPRASYIRQEVERMYNEAKAEAEA